MYMYVAEDAEKEIYYDCYLKKNACLDAFFIYSNNTIIISYITNRPIENKQFGCFNTTDFSQGFKQTNYNM